MKTRILVVLASLLLTAMCFGQSAPKGSGQNPGFPRVVARLNLHNRTKAIGPEILYTPTQSGVFRITGIMVCTIANGSEVAAWNGSVSWTNELGANSIPFFGAGTRAPNTEYGSWVINATANSPITLQITAFDDTSNTQYNAYIILEQLE